MAGQVKFYVTVVRDCEDCDGTGHPALFTSRNCATCGGAGTIEDAVELATALTALGILPRLDQVERTAGRAMQYADGLANGGI